ncbi:PP0621 family protein [Dechloromonas sp. ZY10]|uniref:PP0621 family protein n=1 Tax=Dechloromonas aquae TaxID=2664436 RepID=UPI003528BDD1
MKYLLLLVFLAVLWWIFRRPAVSGGNDIRAEQKPPESMYCCAYCGVHFPASDGEEAGGRHYCSSEHRRASGQ